MKRLFALFVLTLPLFAQQQSQNNFEIFVYSSNVAFTHSERYGTSVDQNLGAAVSMKITPRVSLEAATVAQKWWEYEPGPYHFGVPIVRIRRTVYPISIDGQYHFFNDGRWKPYLGLGVRYVSPKSTYYNLGTRVAPEITGGVSFMMTPHLALRFDAKQEIQSQTGPAYDPLSRASIGLGWHF
jgi:outer membrane protein W